MGAEADASLQVYRYRGGAVGTTAAAVAASTIVALVERASACLHASLLSAHCGVRTPPQ